MGSRFRKFIGIAGAVLILFQNTGQIARADEGSGTDPGASAHHCHHAESCTQATAPASVNLDLSSTTASVVFNGGCQATPVNIDVAGTSQAVNAGQMLTPAQAVAAYQVMHGGVQNILLGADGSAIGGSMVIGSHLANMLNSLVIPTGVTVVDRTSTLNLAGDLTNSGTLLAVSTNPAITAATVSAANILNGQSGLLTTTLPDGGLASLGLSSYSNLVSNLSLNLNAINNIINSGIISSAGNLSMTAGGSIQNIMANPGAAMPVMQAVGTLSMLAPQITNAGMIQSLYGNINVLSSLASSNINITGTQGVMEALSGSINLRDALYTGFGNIDIFGGDYLSRELNLYSGSGAVNVTAGLVTGVLSTYAEAAHIVVDTPTLVIGNSCVIGDPLWANTGNLQINGTLSTGQATAIIAGGDITGDTLARIITGGGNLWLVAGANITNISGTPTSSPITNGAASVTSATFQFDNTHGGNIDFSNNGGGYVLDTSSTTGGNVYLLANSNAAGNGNIWFTNNSLISTNGTAGAGGSVLIAAGGNGGTAQSGPISQAIQAPYVQTASTTNSGAVTIVTGAPTITNGGGVATFIDSGTTSTTATFGYNAPTTASQMNLTSSVVTVGYGGTGASGGVGGGNGGAITLISGGNLQVAGNLLSYGGGGQGGYFYGIANGGNGGNAGAISVTSGGGNIEVNGEINASGGGGGGGSGSNGGSGGAKANILLSAPAGSVTTSDIFSYAGGNGGAGALVNAGGGGGSFGGGGGGSGVFYNGGNGGAGGGTGAASGGGGGVGAGVGNFGPGGGGGFSGGGAGGNGTTASGTAGTVSGDLTYGSGLAGGSGGGSPGSGGTPSGSGSTQLAGGGLAGTDGDENGGNAGSGSTTGGTLTVNYFTSQTFGTRVVASTTSNQTVPLTSLDLANATVQSSIGTLIGTGLLGLSGTQTLGTYKSVTIGSSVPTNVVTLGSLTALNVPNTYTLTFTGFTNSSPTITVNLTNSSTTQQVLVGGTTSFTNSSNSVGAISVTSTVSSPPGAALSVSATGTLTSDKTLTVTAPDVQNLNIFSASNTLNVTASSGNIFGTATYQAPTISLTATSGNITADGTGSGSALLVNSGGLAGLNLFASGSFVNLSDTNSEAVTLANSSSPLNGSSAFTLTTAGNILTSTTGNTAITSPVILLTSTGRIGADSSASAALLINSGGTSGLSLFASGTTVNLNDANSEAVTLIGSSAVRGTTSFTLSAVGNIIGGASITSPSGTNFVFTSYDGTTNQVFSGSSFVNAAGTISVVIGALTYSFDTTGVLPIPNGGTITFSHSGSGTTFVVVNNTGGSLSSASSIATAFNSYFQNGSAIYSTPQVQGPIVSLTSTSGNLGGNSSALTPLLVNNNGSAMTLYARGSVVNLRNSTAGAVTLANSSSALIGTTSFALNAQGNILAATAGNTAIASPIISLTSTTGNIGGNSSASSSLRINSGGTSGLSLYANGSGTVFLQDANSEAVTLANGSGALLAITSFRLVTNGNILASTPANVAVGSAIISLTATGGNIGGNSSASSALKIAGGTGLSLFASGATVNLSDSLTEAVTLSNSSSALAGSTSFTLNAVGNILASTAGNNAIIGPIISLTSSTGNVAANSAGTTALRVTNISSGLSLFASGAVVNLTDTGSETVTLANGTSPVIGSTSFKLNTIGSIAAAASTAAIRSPIINLTSSGNISTTGTTPLTVQRGSSAGALDLVASATAGAVYVQDTSGDTVTLNGGGAGSVFSLANSGDITVAQAGINASGAGARIDLKSSGTITIDLVFVQADGTSSNDGLIQFTSLSGNAPLTIVNNGIIQTSNANSSSVVGFNSGTSLTINLTGSGSVTSDTVNFGNLNPTTLAIQAPFTVVASPITTYTLDNISIQQTGGVSGSLIQVAGTAPIPPAPSPSSGSSSSSTSLFTTFLSLLQVASLSQQQQSLLSQFNEQIGTRLSTDYTPPLEVYNLKFPLQGNVQVEQLAASGQALFSAGAFTKEQLDMLTAQGIVFGPNSNSGFLQLNKGDVLFMPTSEIQVQTQEGLVTIPKGAVVWIMETGNDAAVYDLHDTAKDPVKVVANGKEMTLSPGTQILMTRDSKGSFESLNPGGVIGTRNVRDKDLGGGIKAYIADFTITGGIFNVQVLRGVLKSNNPEHIKAANKILKNAAILSDLGGYKTPYKTK